MEDVTDALAELKEDFEIARDPYRFKITIDGKRPKWK
jgi:hypothetical protein